MKGKILSEFRESFAINSFIRLIGFAAPSLLLSSKVNPMPRTMLPWKLFSAFTPTSFLSVTNLPPPPGVLPGVFFPARFPPFRVGAACPPGEKDAGVFRPPPPPKNNKGGPPPPPPKIQTPPPPPPPPRPFRG